jgi:hypothetical protein
MAGGITHRKEDRLFVRPSLGERFLAPWIPIHWIVGMLKKVRALFAG